MRAFFSVILGIILLVGAILSVPLATEFMNRSVEHLEHFWRWRLLGVLTLTLGVGLVILAFVLIPRIIGN